MNSQENSTKWYSVVFSRRWLAYFVVVVIFAAACVGLALWQFDRRTQAQEEIQRVLSNYNSAPISLSEALPDISGFDENLKWQPVLIEGEYIEDDQLLVRSRPREGQAGVEVLSPLKTSEGTIFIVNRGWLPLNIEDNTSYDIPQPPEGQVEVIARLKAGEPGIPGRDASEGQVATIELPLIESILGNPTYTGAYGILESENPQPSETPPLAPPEPTLDEGAHLSYALQWIMFGILGFVALVWAILNELKIRRGKPTKTRKKVRLTEEEIVDALLESRN